MCPIYSNGQPMDCKFPRGVCLAQDLIIPLFKLVISRKYARDFSVECNQSPYLYNEHDLWLYYADSSHPSLSQQESIYQNSVFTPNHTSSRLSVQWLWLLEWNLQKQKAQSAPHNDFHNRFLLSYCFRQSRKWQIFIFFLNDKSSLKCRFGSGDPVLQDWWITNFPVVPYWNPNSNSFFAQILPCTHTDNPHT